MKLQHGLRRVVIEDASPQIDGGRRAIRRIAGDDVFVTGAIFADGKNELAAYLHYRHSSDVGWRIAPMHACPVYDDACGESLIEVMARYPDLANATRYDMELPVRVDRERARFSSWYELFPRSTSPIPGQHGTFRDVELCCTAARSAASAYLSREPRAVMRFLIELPGE